MVVASASQILAQGAQQLWATNCANCHGTRGQGGGAGTLTLLTKELMSQDVDRRFFDAIKSGVEEKGMPAFSETMSNAQMWALVNHIRELQQRAHRQGGGGPREQGGMYRSTHADYTIETVVSSGISIPWSVDFLPSGEMLIADRPGAMRLWKDGKLSGAVQGVPKVVHRGQGGLMDVAVHPDFAKNNWVFLSFAAAADRGSGNFTRIVRGTLKPDGGEWALADLVTVFDVKQEHFVNSTLHFGCRIVFDPADSNVLFFCIGERGQGRKAQDLALPNGKIYRIKVDGAVPSDNPFVGQSNAYAQIWSYGHRNPQGMCFDLNGNLWATEHGPRGGDELNLITKGRNYGWPLVSFGIEYSGAPLGVPWPELEPAAKAENIAMPTYRWMPSSAACGLDVVRPGPRGEAFPKWKGDLVSGGLAGQSVDRLRVKVSPDGSSTVMEVEEILLGQGRVRDVVCGPEGAVYIVLNDPDKVVRLVPAKP